MAFVVRTEKRICPFCGYKYIRKVYNKNSDKSICPKCRKRSDYNIMYMTRYKNPAEPVVCKNPNCNNLFYKYGLQEYCPECHKAMVRERNRLYMKKYRET